MNKAAVTAALAALTLALAGALLAQDSTAAALPDSGATVAAPADSAVTAALAGPETAADSAFPVETLIADVADAIPADSAIPADALDPIPADSTAPAADSTGRVRPAARPTARRPGGGLLVQVIAWDWDEHTRVTEVGLRELEGAHREFSLARNAQYDKLFKLQGSRLVVRGRVERDDDGFFSIGVESFAQDSLSTVTQQASRGPGN